MAYRVVCTGPYRGVRPAEVAENPSTASILTSKDAGECTGRTYRSGYR